MYYNEKISYNNMTYSIDMIRLKTYIDYTTFSNLDFYLRTYHNETINKFWISDRIMQFKYNYNIMIEEGKSFYISFHHNNEKSGENKNLHNLTIEFNPNKLKDNNIIKYVLNLSGEWYIKSYDLAVDLKINIRDIIIDKGKKRKVQLYSNGGDDVTYRIGESDLKIKIYNKKKESKLDIQGDLTRIEISRILDDYPIKFIKMLNYGTENFPEIYINNFICSIILLINFLLI